MTNLSLREYQERIGKNVSYLRKKAGIRQYVLAENVGYTPSYLCLIENGKRDLTVSCLVKLAEALDVKPGEILDRDLYKEK